jgi:hypothetical protein
MLFVEMFDAICRACVVFGEPGCNRIRSNSGAITAVGGPVIDRFTEPELVRHFLEPCSIKPARVFSEKLDDGLLHLPSI